MNNSVSSSVVIQSDIGLTCEALTTILKRKGLMVDSDGTWWKKLQTSIKKNIDTVMVS